MFHISTWGGWSFVWGAKPPRGDGTGLNHPFSRNERPVLIFEGLSSNLFRIRLPATYCNNAVLMS